MSLIKTISLSGIATSCKILSGILILKILAIYAGPAGVGVAGQFLAFALLFGALASGGVELGLIKCVAEHSESESQLRKVVYSAAVYSLSVTAVFIIFSMIFCKQIAYFLFQDEQFANVIFWLSCSALSYSMHIILFAIFRGFRQIGNITKVMCLSSVINLLLAWFLTRRFGVQGALYAIVISQNVLLLLTLIFAARQHWFAYLFCQNSFSWRSARTIIQLAVVRLVQLSVIPLSQVIVRSDINALFGWHTVGYWQGVLRISDAFLLFAQVFITSYYLPRLASLHQPKALRSEVHRVFCVLMPIVLALLSTVYLLRDFIIVLIYSSDFMPARSLFCYQFLGDAFRIAGLLFSCVFIAKSRIKAYIICELILGIFFIIASHLFARWFGVIGVTYAFSAAYCLYFVIVLLSSHSLIRGRLGTSSRLVA